MPPGQLPGVPLRLADASVGPSPLLASSGRVIAEKVSRAPSRPERGARGPVSAMRIWGERRPAATRWGDPAVPSWTTTGVVQRRHGALYPPRRKPWGLDRDTGQISDQVRRSWSVASYRL